MADKFDIKEKLEEYETICGIEAQGTVADNEFYKEKPKLKAEIITEFQRLQECETQGKADSDAVIIWEQTMMKLVGEDGIGSVTEAILKLKEENTTMRKRIG